MKILILKPSSLGDVVQALPVMRLLKRHLPQSRIYWWVESGLAPLLENDPDLSGVLRFDRKNWTRPRSWAERWRRIRWVREQRFDWVIDLQCLARSGAFAWLANGAFTVGLDTTREGARGFYDRVVPRASYHTHAVDWYLSVLPLLGIPTRGEFDWLPVNAAAARRVRERWPVEGSQWLAIQPGARWLNKRWPADSFASLAKRLAAEYPHLRFAVLGGRDDQELTRIVASAVPERALDLAGQLSLPEMVEWIRSCSLMVSNDTGPMHVAAALGKPVVTLFGPTEPRRTGPYGQLDRVLQLNLSCVPCMRSRCARREYLECLRALEPAIVFERVRGLLNGLPPQVAPKVWADVPRRGDERTAPRGAGALPF